MGPMEYGDAVYVPVNEKADLEKNGIAQGYLAERGERCDSRFYQLAIANLLYTDPTGKTNLVQTAGTDGGTYALGFGIDIFARADRLCGMSGGSDTGA